MNKHDEKQQENSGRKSEDDHLSESEYGEIKTKLLPQALVFSNGDAEEAEELIDEAIARALLYIKGLFTIESKVAYLRTVMRNFRFNKRRKETEIHTDSLDDPDREIALAANLQSTEKSPQEAIENKEFMKAIRIHAGKLNSEEEKIFVDVLLNDRNRAEVAKELGVTLAVFKVKFNAVRAKVRFRLQKARTAGLL